MTAVPAWIEEVFENFLSCEFTYIRDGQPVSFPVVVFYEIYPIRLVVTTSIAFAKKLDAIRENPRVSLLFSNAEESGLNYEPVVLVQGLAEIDDSDLSAWKKYLPLMVRKQPKAAKLYDRYCKAFLFSKICRRVNDFYLLRVLVRIAPVKVFAWRSSSASPEVISLEKSS